MQGSSHLGGSSTQPSQASLTVSGILWVSAGPQNLLSALREWRGGGNPRCQAPFCALPWSCVSVARAASSAPGCWARGLEPGAAALIHAKEGAQVRLSIYSLFMEKEKQGPSCLSNQELHGLLSLQWEVGQVFLRGALLGVCVS